MVNCHIKKYLIIFFVLVQGAVAFSCASDDEVLEVVDLSVNKEVVDFKSEAGTQNITVSTNAPTWEAKADKNWCTLSVAGKILKVSVDESEERLVREATITITAEGQKKMVIGNKGAKIKTIGIEARKDMQEMFEAPVHLELWVKVKSGWADDERALRSLGYVDDL